MAFIILIGEAGIVIILAWRTVKGFVRSPLLGSVTKDDGPPMRPARNGPKVLLQNFFSDWLERTNHISKTLSDALDLATQMVHWWGWWKVLSGRN